MKTKVFLTTTILITILASCSIFKKTNTATYDKGVVINGVCWATRNVDEPGTFAPTPESAGKFYQWNRKKAWNTTDEKVEGWVKSKLNFYFDLYIKGLSSDNDTIDRPCSNYWEKNNNPCPEGWIIPDDDDFETLLEEDKVAYEWVTYNGVEGAKFTDKKTKKSIFLPAIGDRDENNGALNEGWGNYWSSMWGDDCEAYGLDFGSQNNIHVRTVLQSTGNNIRPIACNNSPKNIDVKFKKISYGKYKYNLAMESGVELIKKTNRVPTDNLEESDADNLEELYGFEFSITSKKEDRGLMIDGIAVKCIFPDMKINSEENKFKEITHTYRVSSGTHFINIRNFVEDFEIVKGGWKLQMFYKNKKVLEQKFIVEYK